MSDDARRESPGVDPGDLDISKSEYVRELGDDRYVVSAGSRPPRASRERGDASAASSEDRASTGSAADAELPDPDAVRDGEMDAGPATTDGSPAGTRPPTGGPTGSDTGPTPTASPGAPRAAEGDPLAGDDESPGDTAPDDSAGAGEPASRSRPASHGRRGAPRSGEERDATARTAADLDAGAVGQWLAASLADTEFAYGFDATLSVDGRTARHRMASDDVVETFETLVAWFADAAAGDDADLAEALGILLASMDAAPRLPPDAVRGGLADLGLSRDESVGDLLDALDREGGLRLR